MIPTANDIAQHIDQDAKACKQILSLLEEERAALGNRDTDKLDDIIKQKAVYLSQLENGAIQRTQWVKTNTKDPQALAEKWEQLLQSQAPKLTEKWSEFRHLLDRCRAENEINGKLLARNQQVFSRLLSILRGQGETLNTYSVKGSKPGSQGGHSLGEA